MAAPTNFDIHADLSLEDLHGRLGDVPLRWIRAYPPPGTATEKDLLEAERRTGRICELIGGVLVEKTMGYDESELAAALVSFLYSYLEAHPIGSVAGADGSSVPGRNGNEICPPLTGPAVVDMPFRIPLNS